MKTLKDSLQFTRKSMKDKMQFKEDYYTTALAKIEKYLSGEVSPATFTVRCNILSSWYIWNFIYEYLEHGVVDYQLLLKSTMYGVYVNKWEYNLGLIYEPYKDCSSFKTSAAELGQLYFLGLTHEAEAYKKLLLTMMQGKQSKGFVSDSLYPWFILLLTAPESQTEIKEADNYPSDLLYYNEVLQNAFERDDQKTNTLLSKLCDYHIAESSEYAQVKEPKDPGIESPFQYKREYLEFSSAKYFIFPIEILTWLSIRKQKGLSYTGFTHPLVNLEINKLPETPLAIPETDPLIKACFNKLATDYPDKELLMV